MKKRKSPFTPLRVKAKGKETRPGYLGNALRPTARARTHAREKEPLWLRLWRRAVTKLPPKGRAVLAALAIDWRTAPAAKIAGVSRPTVDSWKTKLKTHFAQCWRAYERDFAK